MPINCVETLQSYLSAVSAQHPIRFAAVLENAEAVRWAGATIKIDLRSGRFRLMWRTLPACDPGTAS